MSTFITIQRIISDIENLKLLKSKEGIIFDQEINQDTYL